MAERMLQFTKVARTMPAKRDAAARTADFDEIYAEFSPEAAEDQATTASFSQSGILFCSRAARCRTIFPTG